MLSSEKKFGFSVTVWVFLFVSILLFGFFWGGGVIVQPALWDSGHASIYWSGVLCKHTQAAITDVNVALLIFQQKWNDALLEKLPLT